MWKAITSDYLSDILILYCFVTFWFVGGLTVFHFYLISTNQVNWVIYTNLKFAEVVGFSNLVCIYYVVIHLLYASCMHSSMQTTYENFRYRYDKKENPYNRGMISNFKEVFFSRIPPSMNDFRAMVKEDEAVVMETTGNFMGGDVTSKKEKIDIEMGSSFVDSNGNVIPDLLRNLEFDDIEDNIKHKEGSERSDSSSLFVVPESTSRLAIEAEANHVDKCDATVSESEHNEA